MAVQWHGRLGSLTSSSSQMAKPTIVADLQRGERSGFDLVHSLANVQSDMNMHCCCRCQKTFGMGDGEGVERVWDVVLARAQSEAKHPVVVR
jgi:hypothetical protein